MVSAGDPHAGAVPPPRPRCIRGWSPGLVDSHPAIVRQRTPTEHHRRPQRGGTTLAAGTAQRVALMSIHPQYADAILAGTKRVEFRKRRLAPDVSTVVIYATRPVGRIVGTFEVLGHDVAAPDDLWDRHSAHAGIHAAGFREYFAQTPAAVGILIGGVQRLNEP